MNTKKLKGILTLAIIGALVLLCIITRRFVYLKAYSVVINSALLIFFASSLVIKPNICFRFACLGDRRVLGSTYEGRVKEYCKKVTIVWCVFFIANGSVAAFTTFYNFGSAKVNNIVWATYNCAISYCLMGTLFAIELIVRHKVDKSIIKSYPITKFTPISRKKTDIVAYSTDGSVKTWGDFLFDTATLRDWIALSAIKIAMVHIEDYYYFLVALVALLQKKCEVHLTQNTSEEFLREVLTPSMTYMTDEVIEKALGGAAAFDPKSQKASTLNEYIPIDADQTRIFLYTSGSTGKPKKVLQRMTEFEADNAFIIKRFGSLIENRKMVSTVSAHHIYGFLFGVTLPFSLGICFRRERLQYIEEFEKLGGEEHLIITTPAFLKRVVEVEEKLALNNPFIFTSGGACSKEVAKKTQAVFGFCPLEVYGSTETSGVAYRQQEKDGLWFTPFDNAKVWLGEDGCLRIISPYIKDPEGFATSDLAKFREDGKFLLLGRSDSVVKIEEKRISLTEVEARLTQTGLVKDVKVIALSNEARQYLAAALVLNDKGKEKFLHTDKYLINRYFHDYLMQYFENVTIPKRWRYLDALPMDTQGKKHKEDIEKIFDDGAESDKREATE